MTISAQVIDTIVEWIDDNLNQPLRIDDIARHAGYSKWHLQRLFMQYKGESLGRYVRERKLSATCATPTRRCMIFVSSMVLIRSKPLRAFLPARSTCRQALIVKKSMVVRIEMFNRPAKTSAAR